MAVIQSPPCRHCHVNFSPGGSRCPLRAPLQQQEGGKPFNCLQRCRTASRCAITPADYHLRRGGVKKRPPRPGTPPACTPRHSAEHGVEELNTTISPRCSLPSADLFCSALQGRGTAQLSHINVCPLIPIIPCNLVLFPRVI